MDVIYFLRSIKKKKTRKKTSVYILKPYREIGQSLEESLRGGKLVKDLEIFWMNNKIIIEFGFRMMWKIMQISENVIHPRLKAEVHNSLLKLHNSSHHTEAEFNNC